MEFAGRELPEAAELEAEDIYRQMLMAREVGGDNVEGFDETVLRIKHLASNNPDVNFALFEKARTSDPDPDYVTGRVPVMLAINCLKIDREMGNRMLHAFMTEADLDDLTSGFEFFGEQYAAGKVTFEDYHPTFVTYELQMAKWDRVMRRN